MLPDVDLSSKEAIAASVATDPSLISGNSANTSARWQRSLARVINSVVRIHVARVRSFDGFDAATSQATGFIVDREKGYILTNRHVVGPGPFWGYCTFSNHEECDVHVAYYDPIHDFAFLQFDPTSVRHANIEALELKPEAARVGVEVRIIGNDSGEVLSISNAVISRMNRNPPAYEGFYSDINTNYIQASAGSKGGSSGSPVVDINGDAVALQAGGKSVDTTNFFLPLGRITRALEHLRLGTIPTRGSLQAEFVLESFDICRRLGLKPDEEKLLREAAKDAHSMLRVNVVLPEGIGDGKLAQGDLVLSVQGDRVLDLADLEAIMDDNVGKSVTVQLRRGQDILDLSLEVADLYKALPDRCVIIGGGVFHDLSLIMAGARQRSKRGVYCASSGLHEIPDHSIIESVAGTHVDTLDEFVAAILSTKQKETVKLVFRGVRDVYERGFTQTSLFESVCPQLEMWTRDPHYRNWAVTKMNYCSEKASPRPASKGTFLEIESLKHNGSAAYVANTIVSINCLIPIDGNGLSPGERWGHGFIIDAENGIVLTSRATVPISIVVVKLFIASIEVKATVKFLHPTHGWALVQYDPSKVNAPTKSLKLSRQPVELGDEGTLVCVDKQNGNRLGVRTTIADIRDTRVEHDYDCPRYRGTNFDAVYAESSYSWNNELNALINEQGEAIAVWMEFERPPPESWYKLGLSASDIAAVIDKTTADNATKFTIIDADFTTVSIARARDYGLSEAAIENITTKTRRQDTYQVHRVWSRPTDEQVATDNLLDGDIILSIDDQLVTDYSVINCLFTTDAVPARVVRDGKEMDISIPTISINKLETDKVLQFQGITIHKAHTALRQMMTDLPSSLYIDGVDYGSPGNLYGVRRVSFITHVNNIPTPDIDSFLDVVRDISDNEFFRMNLVQGTFKQVTTLKKCNRYFSTQTLESREGVIVSKVIG